MSHQPFHFTATGFRIDSGVKLLRYPCVKLPAGQALQWCSKSKELQLWPLWPFEQFPWHIIDGATLKIDCNQTVGRFLSRKSYIVDHTLCWLTVMPLTLLFDLTWGRNTELGSMACVLCVMAVSVLAEVLGLWINTITQAVSPVLEAEESVLSAQCGQWPGKNDSVTEWSVGESKELCLQDYIDTQISPFFL